MNVSKNFILQEYVPKILWDYKGENSIWFLDKRLFSLVQFIRDHFNRTVVINDWHRDGSLNNCGYRMPDTKMGASLSQHKFGRAADLHFEGITDYQAIRQEIQDKWPLFKDAGLTTIEADTQTWLHVDIRNTNIDNLLIVPYR